MNIKTCEICGEKYSTNTFTSCPSCRLMNDDQFVKQIKEESEKYNEYKKDTTFRIENTPGEKESLKGYSKSLVAFIIALSILLLLSLPWTIIIGKNTFADPFGDSSILFFLFLFVFVFDLVCSFAIIYIITLLIKIKYLMKKGIILKNVKFIAENDFPTSTRPRPLFLKAKVKYITDDGVEHEFKGIIPTNLVKNDNVCDILVNPNNYKKYIMRCNID